MTTPESVILHRVIKVLYDTYPDALVVRINSGAFKVGGRYIRTTNFPGISDVVFFHEKATVFIECKTVKGKLNDNQVKFQHNCKNKNLHYIVVTDVSQAVEYINQLLGDKE